MFLIIVKVDFFAPTALNKDYDTACNNTRVPILLPYNLELAVGVTGPYATRTTKKK